jgi:hypothetical protein
MNPIRASIEPYWSAIKLTGFLILVAGALLYGRSCGKASNAADLAKAERARDGWRDAASKWETAIKAQNSENAKARDAAEYQRRKMDAAIAAADKAADKFLKRLAELNRQAEADKLKCNEERARICGAPLR